MSFAAVVMRRVVRRLLIVQFAILMVVALVYLALNNINGSIAALYGGSISLSGTLLMAWRINRAGEIAAQDTRQGSIEVYTGVMQKFILTLLLMAVGMGYLKLDPIAVLISFALTQLSFTANKVDTAFKNKI